MAGNKRTEIKLTAYDDLFETDQSREEAKLSKIRDIPISQIDEFPDHPFKVLMDEDMEQLIDSIKRSGVMTPATVRLKEDGRYELISGHRRKKACELAGLETLKCEVKELTRDEAIIVMVESNLQRTTILPSEKAFAYKMRLEAMNRQGKRTDLTCSPVGNKLQGVKSSDELAEKVGESKNQIFRYIRLTELVPEILQMVDDRQIAFRPAVEISYLTEEQQYTLLEAMSYNDATPSLAQAIKMKKFNQDGKLTNEVIQSIMEEEKPNQKEKPAFRDERITKLIPKSVPRGQEADFVVKALEFYKEITIDNRRYLIESIGEINGDVSMRDITFQNNVGFPINRVEKIGYIRRLLEQAEKELPPEEKAEAPASPSAPAISADRHNYHITDDALGVGGAKEKFRNNMAAVNLLHELQLENRLATPEEQETLAKYVGWGGLSMAFDENNAAWAEEFKELYACLSPEEYRAAKESTLTAFYTPPVVIKAMYEALDRLGFSQGNILEPSCGTGNFFGLLPENMAGSKLHGVEIDPLTGEIAKQLYQKAKIAVDGFEDTKLPDNHFDVVLGNVPFGEFKVDDSRYNAQKFLIHDYFFAKALDKVRTGGVVMFVTSKGTMDKANQDRYPALG